MLHLKNITKSFSGLAYPVLNDLTLTLEKEDFCVIVGTNGSGKSTLMKMMAGDDHPDSGMIFMEGANITHKDRSGVIAHVVQDVNKGTIPEMTLLENMVLSHLRLNGSRMRFYSRFEEEVGKSLAQLNLPFVLPMQQSLQNLSGGQRQMVATVMAISSNPKILLLDEHTSALDPKTQHLLMDYTAEHIKDRGMTCVMITHHLEDALRYGNRLIFLEKGRVLMDVRGQEKKSLTLQTLLSLFHRHSGEPVGEKP